MGSLYLPWPEILAEVNLVLPPEYMDGWEFESRSSGGFDEWPLCVMWHHTAGGGSDESSAVYMKENSDIAPVANFMPGHDGKPWVMAAGATNTNGSGRSLVFSRGTVPTDSMNTRAMGMEIHNNGVGEQYPTGQLELAIAVSNAANRFFGNQPEDIAIHWTYAPDRKIDPATVDAVSKYDLGPAETAAGTWRLEALQAVCRSKWEDPDMPLTKEDKEWIRKTIRDEVWQKDMSLSDDEAKQAGGIHQENVRTNRRIEKNTKILVNQLTDKDPA